MAQMHIIDISKNATTGLITMEARIIDTSADPEQQAKGSGDGVGAVERFHVEALEITNKYNGQVERWLAHVGREMLHRHKLRTAAHNDISKWHGKLMDIKG